ncbi:E3 ubiquitin-protein ligase RNF216-like [Euwallacea fornicatus]|uniref:E3 ubiquitin-protein ligase RNF216-like n=1 Tax=Euwallacea fornicatus TaxID=995702 RepID=UPI00338FD586
MDYFVEYLKELCPHRSEIQIREVFAIINEERPEDSPEQKVENAFNMLSTHPDFDNPGPSIVQEISEEINSDDSNDEIIAWRNNIINLHHEQLCSMFPDACEKFMWDFCQNQGPNLQMDQAIDALSKGGYVKKVVDVNSIWSKLVDALPGADPSYLRKEAEKLVMQDENSMMEFLNAAVENNDYPTMDEYLKNQEEETTLNFYKKNFSIDKFLEQFPNPETYFNSPNRPNPLLQPMLPPEDLNYALVFLYNNYRKIRKRHVDIVFKLNKKCLFASCTYLDHLPNGMKTERPLEPNPECRNLPLLQEIAYLKHRKLIRKVMKYKDQTYHQFKEEARVLGLLETCGVCGEDELIPEECFNCKKGCMFCKNCIQQYVEVRMGDGLTNFPCCNDCDSDFDVHVLQMVLPRNTFERLMLKIQSEEVKRANVDGLETCPFCEFASIPPTESKVFKCENLECLKESCRLCRHESHIPKRCNEIEYDEDVRRRTFIENMMTEALARTCYKCNKKFIKSNGCNKMICTCGAMMCYLCSQAITGYGHFGDGKTCQLFTNDAQIDLQRVKDNAEKAKVELGNVEIKFDPSQGIEGFFPTK